MKLLLVTATFVLLSQAARSGVRASGDSCVGRCNGAYDASNTCQCDASCSSNNDCCSDVSDCLDSCENRPCTGTDNFYNCQCNSACTTYGDCCADYDAYCNTLDSCANRPCYGDDQSYNCQCNSVCSQYGDCCGDIDEYCGVVDPLDSCADRDCNGDDQSYNCQCNSVCAEYGDCCADKETYCPSSGTGGTTTQSPSGCSKISVSNAELLDASADIWALDVNAASYADVVTNLQSTTSTSSTNDVCPASFFTYVNPEVLNRDTFVKMSNLFDNYIYMEGNPEQSSSTEEQEQSDFLDAFLDTSIGDYLFNFLTTKKQIGCVDKAGFKVILSDIWFGFYDRQGPDDTSGFEHVFCGEVKSTSVSGFHNWVRMYLEEQNGDYNYYGYTVDVAPRLYGLHFEWHTYMKGLSGFSVGTSPELEMALFTLCHLTRPNGICKVQLAAENGSSVPASIQTYTWTKSYPPTGYSYVASAYFLV